MRSRLTSVPCSPGRARRWALTRIRLLPCVEADMWNGWPTSAVWPLPRAGIRALEAERGRVVAADFDGDQLVLEEVRRFPNVPLRSAGTLQWDADRLREDVLAGLHAAGEFRSVGIDTWGVDFGLLHRSGNLLGNPGHYRDERTRGMLEEAFARVPGTQIYQSTGVQFMEINTIYQLLAMVLAADDRLREADRLLTIPALVGCWVSAR